MTILGNEKVNVDAIKPADALQAIYLDWWNNFITVERFAEYYGISKNAGRELIETARRIHENRTDRAA